MANIDLGAGAGCGCGFFEKLSGGLFIHIDFAAVVADLRGHRLDHQRQTARFQSDGRGTGRRLAVFADGTLHGFLRFKSGSQRTGSGS